MLHVHTCHLLLVVVSDRSRSEGTGAGWSEMGWAWGGRPGPCVTVNTQKWPCQKYNTDGTKISLFRMCWEGGVGGVSSFIYNCISVKLKKDNDNFSCTIWCQRDGFTLHVNVHIPIECVVQAGHGHLHACLGLEGGVLGCISSV